MQAVELLTDVNKLAAQARRFLNKSKTTAGPPRSPSVSSRPGTPPGGSAADSMSSPLLSSSRTSLEEERTESKQPALARSNSSGLGRRNMAGPFGTAAAQGDNTCFSCFSHLMSQQTMPSVQPVHISSFAYSCQVAASCNGGSNVAAQLCNIPVVATTDMPIVC